MGKIFQLGKVGTRFRLHFPYLSIADKRGRKVVFSKMKKKDTKRLFLRAPLTDLPYQYVFFRNY